MKWRILIFCFVLTILNFCSCSIEKTLPEGTYLYRGAKVKIIKPAQEINSKKLAFKSDETIQRPIPNKKKLGILWKLHIYNLFQTKKKKGFASWMQKKLGEPPVIYDDLIQSKTEELLKNKAFNEGFFHAKVSSETKIKKRKLKVLYTLEVNNPYTLQSIENNVSHPFVKEQIEKDRDNSILKVNSSYQLDKLKQERVRILLALKENGYYYFLEEDLKFRADSSINDRKINLELLLKDDVDSSHLVPQSINKITIYIGNEEKKDTTFYDDIRVLQNDRRIKPQFLRNAISFKAGQKYSITDHKKTIERLTFLQIYKFINIEFIPESNSDTLLNVSITLTPFNRHKVEGALGISLKSQQYLGPEISLGYLNRNTFKGAEKVKFDIRGNYNYPFSANDPSLIEHGISLSLSKPGLVIPFKKNTWTKKLTARTNARFGWEGERINIPLKNLRDILIENELPILIEKLDADSTYSPFIALNVFDFKLEYQWHKKKNIRHQFTPIAFKFQTPKYQEEELRSMLLYLVPQEESTQDDVLLNLEKMLTLKPSYIFSLNSKDENKPLRFSYRNKLAVSVNRLLGGRGFIPREYIESQFFQIEQDFKLYSRFSKKSTLAYHLAFNVSVPFKNQIVLPFTDLYYIGGPNSVRAFAPRTVGPGITPPSQSAFTILGTGDILLESSIEWRHKLTSLFEVGFFLDAGNVWLFGGGTQNNNLAVFRFNDFYKQLAVGTGFGLRFDFSILLIRLDLSIPLVKPWLPEGERWVTKRIALGSSTWRKENLAFNFAFGYPF